MEGKPATTVSEWRCGLSEKGAQNQIGRRIGILRIGILRTLLACDSLWKVGLGLLNGQDWIRLRRGR
jgi:hypothetical protein